MITEVTRKYQKKEKLVKHLQKKVSNLQVMKESYENSASSILLDKRLFLNYCQNIDGLIQGSLKPLLTHDDVNSKEILDLVRQISSLSFDHNYEESSNDISNLKLSPESLACQSIVNLFCITFNMLIVKFYCQGSEEKEASDKVNGSSSTKDASFVDSSERTLLSSHYSDTNSMNLE